MYYLLCGCAFCFWFMQALLKGNDVYYMATAENIVTVETEKRNGSDPVK